MERYLFDIQETVIKYAEVISQIIGIDVEVVDSNLFRIAGTGVYENDINRNMSAEGYVYRHVLKTGQRKVIYNPGQDELCINCPDKNNCKETIEISTPIKFKDKIIGVIGMVGTSIEQKNRIKESISLYLMFLDQISEFITAKVVEINEAKETRSMLSALDTVINASEQGVIILGKDNQISTINKEGITQLNISGNPIEQSIDIRETGDTISGEKEYKVEIDGRKYTVIGTLKDINVLEKKYCKMFMFQNMSKVQLKMYEMISTVNKVNSRGIIGDSKKSLELKAQIERVAKSTSTVLITGESGTGKEMVATAIWKASNRSNKNFVAINCGAIPEALLESELFGYVKGAFTGADPNGRVGKFELANDGIIFLDEIGDMPLYLQVKLLRVLQERKISRIGSNQLIPLDIRLIAATNKDLRQMMVEKKFREDLYYRLNVIPIEIEPLRNRPEDIEALTYHFINRYAGRFEKTFKAISAETLIKLKENKWQGNVRELENVIEFMVNMMNESGVIDNATLPIQFFSDTSRKESVASEIITIDELEKNSITTAIKHFGNTTTGKKQAADALGIGIATLYRKLEKYNIYSEILE